MPMPIAVAPPVSHSQRAPPRANVTLPARSSAAYEASTAIATDSDTRRGSYDPFMTSSAVCAVITFLSLIWSGRRSREGHVAAKPARSRPEAEDLSGRELHYRLAAFKVKEQLGVVVPWRARPGGRSARPVPLHYEERYAMIPCSVLAAQPILALGETILFLPALSTKQSSRRRSAFRTELHPAI